METDQFNYLVMPIALIAGLSVAHIAIVMAHYVQHRKLFKFYWVAEIWAAILFVYIIQNWYVLYSWRDFGETFPKYLYFLLNPLLIYAAVVVLLPRYEDRNTFKQDEIVNQKKYYYDSHNWFFGLCFFVLLNQTVQEKTVGNQLLFEPSDWPRIVGIALMVLLAISKHNRLHEVSSLIASFLLMVFIAKNSQVFSYFI